MKDKIFIFFLLGLSVFTYSQNNYLDSLKTIAQKESTPTKEKMKVLGLLTEMYRSEEQYKTASDYGKRFLQLAKKEKNDFEITKAYTYLGIIANNQSHYEQTNLYIDSAKVVSSKSNNALAKVYSEYLQAYQNFGFQDLKKSMEHTLSAVSSAENQKDFEIEFKLNYMLYSLYTNWNDLQKSMKYAQASVVSAKASNNKNYLSNAYSIMAVAHSYLYAKTKKKEDLAAIFKFSEEAASLYQKFPGHVSNYTYALARNNIANYYLSYYSKLTPDLVKKIEFNVNESHSILQKSSNSQSLQAGNLGMLSYLAQEAGDLDKSERLLLEANTILQSEKPLYYPMLIQITGDLAGLYKKKGNLEKALEYQEKVTELNSLLFDQTQIESVKKLEAQFQSEKKAKEIQQQKNQKLWYIAGGILALIGSFFMFRSYHFRLKYAIQTQKQLALEKSEADLQVQLQKEEQARLKAEQEVLTLQQEKLQNEVMASQLHLEHKTNILHQLKEKLNNDDNVNIDRIIREENLLDKDFEHTKFQIQEIHPNFFKSIQDKTKQKLTDLDLKYCAYMHLGMNTKQIANVLKIEPKSVSMTKYRIKKKFDLDAETDLVQYIKGII